MSSSAEPEPCWRGSLCAASIIFCASCRTRVIVVFGWWWLKAIKKIIKHIFYTWIFQNLRLTGEKFWLNLLLPLFPMPCVIVKSSGSSRSLSSPDRISIFMSDRLVPVGDARALNSAAEIETPAFDKSFDASSGSNGLGIGNTGKSFVEIPRCCRDMCECNEFRDLATVPQRTQR